MTIKQRIKMCCEKSGVSLGEVSKKMNMRFSTFSTRLKTGKFTKKEIEEIAYCIGCVYNSYFKFRDGTVINAPSSGEQIKSALAHINMTATDLSKKMCISQPAISKRLKTGKFTQNELKQIAAMMDCEYISKLVFKDGMII